jgi:hypothetical protein
MKIPVTYTFRSRPDPRGQVTRRELHVQAGDGTDTVVGARPTDATAALGEFEEGTTGTVTLSDVNRWGKRGTGQPVPFEVPVVPTPAEPEPGEIAVGLPEEEAAQEGGAGEPASAGEGGADAPTTEAGGA